MNLEGLDCLLRSRHSTRVFAPDPVPRILIDAILEAATEAPSAHNAQPWRFVAVTTKSGLAGLRDELLSSYAEDLACEGVAPDAASSRVGRARRLLSAPPAAIAVSLSMRDMRCYEAPRQQAAEKVAAIQSVACAVMVMLLAAGAAGLATCWVSAPLFAPDAVSRALGLPEDWEPQSLVLLGYAGQGAVSRGRKPSADVTLWR